MPCPEEKFEARRPVIDMPAVTAAAACSPSGSTKISGRPDTLTCPAAAASAQNSPIWVDGVIGQAPAASVDSRSHMITAVLPSSAARVPGYLKLSRFSSVLSFVFRPIVSMDIETPCRACYVGTLRSGPLRMIFLAAGPLIGPVTGSIQTIAPVGQRWIGFCVS